MRISRLLGEMPTRNSITLLNHLMPAQFFFGRKSIHLYDVTQACALHLCLATRAYVLPELCYSALSVQMYRCARVRLYLFGEKTYD